MTVCDLFITRLCVFDVQYVYPRLTHCHAHMHMHFNAHYTHDHTYTHTHRTCITHIHTYHTKLPHYNSKQCSVANVHAHMQPNSTPTTTTQACYQSSFRMARTACCCLVRRAIKTLSMNCSQMIMWMGVLWTMWGINLFIAIVSLSTVS